MRKLIFCFSFVCMGVLSSCVDKNELVDEESLPGWLGSSIYGELKNPDPGKGLTGSFKTYLRLVDDLGYTETLSRTGSKTVFPANDEAFARFFARETWSGVKRYEDLSAAQKKMLLYSSMLDNALLIGMLSNTSSSTGVVQGRALKHATSTSVIDTVTSYQTLPAVLAAYGENNPNWTRFQKGVAVVSDATKPMLVHFTREYMLNNSITTAGSNNDFSLITGGDYKEGDAYIFGERVLAQDVTCQNGYIHQVQNVITPPGNMAQVLKKTPNLSLFSHMLDRFAVPVFNQKVTNDYADWYNSQKAIGAIPADQMAPDSIFEVRYQSRLSQGNAAFDKDVNGADVINEYLLNLDPGWNEFYVAPTQSGQPETFLTDLAVAFAPEDEALIKYFTEDEGKSIIDTYGSLPNTKENLKRNLDDVPMNILAKFISNMLRTSFAAAVPSKFNSIVDDAKDLMGITLDDIKKKDDNSYDIKIANNGVIYTTNKVFGPKAYVVVSAPALFNKEMHMINWIIQNQTFNNAFALGLDFYAYLLTTSSNYALFLPTDKAFDAYYLDPASLIKRNGQLIGSPYVYHYYYSPTSKSGIGVSRWKYDIQTGVASDSVIFEIEGAANQTNWPVVKSHLSDIVQYNTVVLKDGEVLGNNKYYKTKHGGTVIVDMNNKTVVSGNQINGVMPVSNITEEYIQKNGRSYSVDRLIHGPTKSVYGVLSENPQFSEFFELCNGFDDDILDWAGISKSKDPQTGIYAVDRYKVFYNPNQRNAKKGCIDLNVKFFNSYNYTVFAPNNEAMKFAYEHGLPKWETVNELYVKFAEQEEETDDAIEAKKEVRAMVEAIKAFTRYHFQNTSVYVDNEVETGNFITFFVNDNSISQELSISGGNGQIIIRDATDERKVISASTGLVNEMTREFEFVMENTSKASYASSSSFAVVHELTKPLSYNKAVDYSKGSTEVSASKNHK